MSECLPCGEGTFGSSEGAAECDICPAGLYVTQLDHDTNGFGVMSGGETCVACPAGTFSGAAGLSSSAQCIDCPAGAWCSGGKQKRRSDRKEEVTV